MTPSSLVVLLARASVEGALFVLLVAVITRLAPRMPASARCALWWLACFRLLLGLVPLPPLRVSLPPLSATPEPMREAGARVLSLGAPISAVVAPLAETARPALAAARLLDPLAVIATLLLAVWLLGMVAAVIAHGRDARRLMRLWRDAAPVDSRAVRDWFTAWVGTHRAGRVELRASSGVGSPLIMGGFRTRIVVPAACLDHDTADLRMALAHEMSHVRRGDLGWGLVPALAQCVFWFHPFVHWCVNEYAQSREEACDAEALRLCDAAPHRYGELLVGFGVDATRRVHAAASCGSSHVQQLKRRLRMLAHATRSSRTQRALAVGATLVIGLLATLPVRLVSASPTRHECEDKGAKSGARSASACASPSASATVASATKSASAARSAKAKSSGFSYTTASDSKGRFAYGTLHGDAVTMSGSFNTDEDQWLDRLREQADGDEAWFRVDGTTYVVKGEQDIARIEEIMRPEIELGHQQGKLGEMQGRLGGKQGELGERQSALGDAQSEVAERLSQIASAQAELAGTSERREDLERQSDELHEKMEAISEKMSELGRLQGELGEQQGKLGEMQSELGRQQEKASREGLAKVRELSRELIRTRRAVPLED